MKKPILCIVLTLTLLISTCFCDLLLPGSADTSQAETRATPYAPNGTDITVTNINSPSGKNTLKTFTDQANWLDLTDAYTPTIHAEVPLQKSNVHPTVQGGSHKMLTDNLVPGISNNEDSANQKVFWPVSDGAYLLFDMSIVCKKIRHILVAGSYTEAVKYGTILGDVKVYIGDDMSTLIQEQNCYAALTVSICSIITLPETIDARYVAIWFGGHSGYVRLSEVGVYCDYVTNALNLPTSFTADSPVGEGKLSVKITRTPSDLYDTTQLQSVKGVRLVEKDMPRDIPKSFDDGWLSPKGGKMYTLELYDENRKAVTFSDPHMIVAQMPNMDDKANTICLYQNGRLTRPWNIIPTADRSTMLLGQDVGNKGTLYYTEPIHLVFMKFNTPDEVRTFTNQKVFSHFSLDDVNGNTIVTY